MKFPLKYFLLFLTFLSLSSFRKQQQVNDWVYEREKKGIKVFTKKSKWGRLRDSKAVMNVSSSPEEMFTLLTDFNNYTAWVPRCKKANVVARPSEFEYIVYFQFNSPWPVADRDCVVRIKVDRNVKTGVITITETSEPKYLKPIDGVVRIEQIMATWKITPLPSGGSELINEYATNPGGNIPDWMTNTQSVENPIATFENLKEQVETKNSQNK